MADEESKRVRPAGYTGWVGLAFIVLIVVAIVNGARTEETGLLGVDGPTRGWKLPRFAAPLATSGLEGDANIDEDAACKVHLDGAVRVCDYFDKPLVISFWFTRQADCVSGQDTFDRIAQDHARRLNFLSVNVRDDRDEVRELVAERGWTVPVVHDRDGAVSNVYGVGGCPTVAYAFPGGILMDAKIGDEALDAEAMSNQVDRLIAASARRERRR